MLKGKISLRVKVFSFYLVMQAVIFLGLFYLFAFSHEAVHSMILTSANIDNNIVSTFYFLPNKTVFNMVQYQALPEERQFLVSSLNLLNEVFGYQIMILFLAIFISNVSLAYLIITQKKNEVKNN